MTATITKKMMLFFPKCECEKPIIYHLVKDYNLIVNVFRAKVTPEEEGYLVLDVTAEESQIEKGMQYVRSFNVNVDPADKGVRWDPDKCTHCGNCIPHCPTQALHIPDRVTMKIAFKEQLCIECLACEIECIFHGNKGAYIDLPIAGLEDYRKKVA